MRFGAGDTGCLKKVEGANWRHTRLHNRATVTTGNIQCEASHQPGVARAFPGLHVLDRTNSMILAARASQELPFTPASARAANALPRVGSLRI